MSVKLYCKMHNQTHTLDAGSAAAIIYTYQHMLANAAFADPLKYEETYSTTWKLRDSLCPRDDIKAFETPQLKSFKAQMAQARRRLTTAARRYQQPLLRREAL